ncbi:glycoside hydrolase family 43 protein [Cohnella fermenti]|uniref:Glycoside hydrolase family 43 protein n=1 Tax=Cohnella fermenti TaxID=2565925 RepID=A0A4S4BF91_9BACL|nr:glycoside hydrolase family 43 protein [Cohnella fermenti]
MRNPVLTGFNPDPSIVRVGDDYYLATSTFEWFPGVAIYHSKDLANWRLHAYPLDRTSLLDLRGNPSSGGIWAPALSHHEGTFYLLYTDMKSFKRASKDMANYLITATDIRGPWSEPIYLHGRGFDPFLFHDDDGRKWVANMRWDPRADKPNFGGIELQEFSVAEGGMVGPVHLLTKGSSLGVTEGPQLVRRDGWYYLLLAEGGTGYNHAASLARSRELLGPYEFAPRTPFMTTIAHPEHPLQKAGHGALVETQRGDWYMPHICARPLAGRRLSPLGREIAIQRVEWTDDGWLQLAGGGILPELEIEGPGLAWHPWPEEPATDHFDAARLSIHLQTLRIPADESWLSLTERPGWLRLRGQESIYSWNRQSMVARRLQHWRAEVETCLEFEPKSMYQSAGLACFCDEMDHFYLRVTRDEEWGKHVRVTYSVAGRCVEPEGAVIRAEGWERIYLKAVFDADSLRFYASPSGGDWQAVGPALDAGQLSDDFEGKLGFTGTMLGLCAQDLEGTRLAADFDYMTYIGHDE